jgi:chemotaxis protein methyltransferase WspC
LEHGFAPAKISMAFACRKPLFAGLSRPVPEPASEALQPQSCQPPSRLTESLRRTDASKLPGSKLGIASDLECARRLADAGRLQEAAALCEAHLQQSRTSAQAYYLLGLVRDAAGDATAREYYRKALYLEPKHYESLVHLAMLAQKSGDDVGARNLRRRADRLMNS